MNRTRRTTTAAVAASLALGALALPATAQQAPDEPDESGAQTRLVVTIENLAPQQGNFQTPFWVGLHDGTFDLYDRDAPASTDPQPGSVALERLAEDGNNAPITEEFAALSDGVDATVPGPNGPIGPGDVARTSFVVDATDEDVRYFSYGSMVLPSNDFFVANGNPEAHQVFSEDGTLVAQSFFITGDEVLDAGTEVDDEIPENTAFFGQMAPDTGVDENGVVVDAEGFQPASEGGILADPRFAMADFEVEGYPIAKISFSAAPAFTEEARFRGRVAPRNEVPSVTSPARGFASTHLTENGMALNYRITTTNLRNVVGAHLHLGVPDENGPIVANLIEPREPGGGDFDEVIRGQIRTPDLTGPLTGQPLDALINEINDGNVYVNIHTNDGVGEPGTGPGDFPAGELRGQLNRVQGTP